jgi:hypothetical protein
MLDGWLWLSTSKPVRAEPFFAPSPRRVRLSLLLAATRWWKPRDRGSGDDCTPGGSWRVS